MRWLALVVAALVVACGSGTNANDAGIDAGIDVGIDGQVLSDGGRCPAFVADPADSPVVFGRARVADALRAAGSAASVHVATADDAQAAAVLMSSGATLSASPESYAMLTANGETWVVGRDATGAMYGALDLAERLGSLGSTALPIVAPVLATPRTSVRGANFFMVLPERDEACWWFRDPDFWSTYFDLLARARINTLDLHGMYNLENTVFPNALLYFAHSASFPAIGVSDTERTANLQALHAIVTMAAARGVHVEFMSYRSDTSLSGEDQPSPLDDAQLQTYTREAVENLARAEPGLWRLGFRIGESLHNAAWYRDTYVAGVQAAGTGVQVSTRTWLSSKSEVSSLASAAGDGMLVEAKYNGEQLGPPYVVHSDVLLGHWTPTYFYEDYLQDPAPYRFVFQVWQSGTNRFFRQASYERARRLAVTLGDSTHIAGATLQPSHAYFPQRDYYHADADRFSPWTFRRDEISYLLFGRLAYDPGTPETVFRSALRARTGNDALWDAMQAASEVVPWFQTAQSCDPDSRGYAADLEWGGTVRYWASEPAQFDLAPADQTPGGVCYIGYHGPYDPFALAAPYDLAQDLLAARTTTRVSPLEVARRVLDAAHRARVAVAAAGATGDNAEARDVARESIALADLGEYFAHKLRAASALAVYRLSGSADYLAAARAEIATSGQAWTALANDTSYVKPFVDRLRMSALLGVEPFHWRVETDAVTTRDPASIDELAAIVSAAPPDFHGTLPSAAAWLDAVRTPGPGLAAITANPPDPSAASWTVTVDLAQDVVAGTTVTLWWKPWRTDSTWRSVAMTASGPRSFQVAIAGTGQGALFAAEVISGTQGWRYPDVLSAAPYVVLAAH